MKYTGLLGAFVQLTHPDCGQQGQGWPMCVRGRGGQCLREDAELAALCACALPPAQAPLWLGPGLRTTLLFPQCVSSRAVAPQVTHSAPRTPTWRALAVCQALLSAFPVHLSPSPAVGVAGPLVLYRCGPAQQGEVSGRPGHRGSGQSQCQSQAVWLHNTLPAVGAKQRTGLGDRVTWLGRWGPRPAGCGTTWLEFQDTAQVCPFGILPILLLAPLLRSSLKGQLRHFLRKMDQKLSSL